MFYTLGEAAKESGKSKSTIKRAIDRGRLSAKKNDKGEWKIDPAELHRVYPLTVAQVDRIEQSELDAAHQQISRLERAVEDLREDRNHWRKQADHLQQQTTALLTDQRGHNGGFWSRLFGK